MPPFRGLTKGISSMSLEQKIIELDHRIIVLNNKLNELSQLLDVTDVDVNTLDERVSDLEDEVHKRTSISANRELQDKYDMALCALKYLRNYIPQAPLKGLDVKIFSYINDILLQLGEPL